MRKKDINTDQKTSSDRPFRPLTPLEKEGVMIAEFMGLKYETRNYFGGDFKPDENGFDTYSHNSIMTGTYYGGKKTSMLVDKMRYHTSWDWLMPVIEKIQDIFVDNPELDYQLYDDIRFNVPYLDDTYNSVVYTIKQYNDGRKQ